MLINPLRTIYLEMRLDEGFRRYQNSLQKKQPPRRPLPMVKPTRRSSRRRHALTLPELEHSKAAVLSSLGSLQSRRSYKHAIDEFICWYCSEPRLALNRAVVLRYRLHLESISLAPSRRIWTHGFPLLAFVRGNCFALSGKTVQSGD